MYQKASRSAVQIAFVSYIVSEILMKNGHLFMLIIHDEEVLLYTTKNVYPALCIPLYKSYMANVG